MLSAIRRRDVAGLVTLLALGGLGWASVATIQPPAPAGVDAPAETFSAARAYAQVQAIARAVHPAGSPAAAAVRDYIAGTLRSYGLEVSIQDAVGLDDIPDEPLAMAHVQNVVAVLPGAAPTGRVFAVAHYDSVQVSYGANDDGAGVTSLLETARAMTHGARPRNDVVFVLTDAEEACLCGAEAFVSQDPLAADGGVALNFESRGSSGPSIMFETSRDNAGVVSVYAGSVPYPVATSFAVEVYRILPNDTDFTMFRRSGRFAGLNSAYIDGSATYHSPEDRPSYMDRGSLQQQGANALALTRAFAAADLGHLRTPSTHDDTYFPVLRLLVRYPGELVWPIAAFALLAVLALAVIVRRRGLAGYGRSAAGFGLALIPLLLAPVLAQLLWLLLVAVRPGYATMIDPWRPGWYRAGVVALAAAVVWGWYGLFRRRFGWALAVGGLGWLAILGLVLAAVTPGGSYLAALPALGGALAALLALPRRSGSARAAGLAAGAAVGVLVLAPTVMLFFPALGLATGGAAAFFATMLGLAALPAFEPLFLPIPVPPVPGTEEPDRDTGARRRRWPGAAPALVAGGLAVVFVAVGLATDRFDAAHPAPVQLMYALDADTGVARWVSIDTAPGSWERRYITGTDRLGAEFPPLGDDVLGVGPAQAAALPAPAVDTTTDTNAGRTRNLTLRIRPQRPVRLIYLRLPDATVRSATVDGRALPPADLAGTFGLLFHAPPSDGLVVNVVLAQTGPVRLRVMDGSDGLTGLPGFVARPPGLGVQGSHDTELALVAKTYTL